MIRRKLRALLRDPGSHRNVTIIFFLHPGQLHRNNASIPGRPSTGAFRESLSRPRHSRHSMQIEQGSRTFPRSDMTRFVHQQPRRYWLVLFITGCTPAPPLCLLQDASMQGGGQVGISGWRQLPDVQALLSFTVQKHSRKAKGMEKQHGRTMLTGATRSDEKWGHGLIVFVRRMRNDKFVKVVSPRRTLKGGWHLLICNAKPIYPF